MKTTSRTVDSLTRFILAVKQPYDAPSHVGGAHAPPTYDNDVPCTADRQRFLVHLNIQANVHTSCIANHMGHGMKPNSPLFKQDSFLVKHVQNVVFKSSSFG